MGAYLSEPIREKQIEEGENERLVFGASSMQGWRVNQEDAHNCILQFESDTTSFFAVYDGHGGPEVSEYASRKFPDFLVKSEKWAEGKLGQSLIDAFLDFDETILSDAVVDELKILAGTKEADEEDEVETMEERKMLYEEARLPLEQLLEKYGVQMRVRRGEGAGTFLSPNLKGKKVLSRVSKDTAPADQFQPVPDMDGERDTQIDNASDNLKEEAPTEQNNPLSNGNVKEETKQEKASGDEDDTLITSAPKRLKLDEEGDTLSTEEEKSGPTEGLTNNSGKENTSNGERNPTSSPPPTTAIPTSTDPSEGEGEKRDASPTHTPPSPISRTSRVSPARRRTSKSESEVRVMRKEEETTGPLTNWNTMGGLGDPAAGRSTGTPETATAASSSDEESGDEEYNAEAHESSDEEGIEDSSSSVEQQDSGEEEEDEEDNLEVEDEESFPVPGGDSVFQPGVDSGTTACVAVLRQNTLYVANAGDSRCVVCRGGKAIDLSIDHKPEDDVEKERIEKAGGKITADGRVNGGLNLSRAIGDHFYKKNRQLPLKDQMISALPDIQVETLQPEDTFMVLACDGIWNSMSSQEVVDFVQERIDRMGLTKICEEMCDHCLAPSTVGDGTGCDNMTVIIIKFKRSHFFANGDAAETEKAGSGDV